MTAIELCTCTNPFCDEQHASLVFAPWDQIEYVDVPDDYDDWEGPAVPEYTEHDEEAYLEMVRDDLRIGAFGL
jgi:hypothetical protein